MKFKKDTSVSSEMKAAAQRETSSSAPKMVKPFNTVPPIKSLKKTAEKSSTKKKKTTKKGESKRALNITDLYEKDNPFKATVKGSAASDTNAGDDSNICSDVATPSREKGNPVSTQIPGEPVSDRKLGLEDLNDAIESTENMNLDKP
jgi:hypothetical protein